MPLNDYLLACGISTVRTFALIFYEYKNVNGTL